jgi:hypothetical protein
MFFQMVLVLSVTPPYSIIQPASPRDMRRHTPKTSQKQSSALSSEQKQVKTSQTTRVANGVEKTKNMMQLEAPFHCSWILAFEASQQVAREAFNPSTHSKAIGSVSAMYL